MSSSSFTPPLAGPVAGSIAIIQEQQASGVGAGGGLWTNSYTTRILNTKVSDLGNIVTAFNPGGAGTFVPIMGTYRAAAWASIGNNTGVAKLKIRNVTASADAVFGGSASTIVNFFVYSHLDGVFTANGTDVYSLQHYSSGLSAGGSPASVGIEVYCDLYLLKIA
jgi:hypothetical protein